MLDPFVILPVVSIEDPALDTDAMGDDLAAYATTRDPALLKIKPGAKPTTFQVRGLSVGYLAGVVESERGKMRALLAVLGAVHEVETYDGRVLQPEKVTTGAFKQKIADDTWLNLLRDEVGFDALEEIGLVAISRAKLPKRVRIPFASSGG